MNKVFAKTSSINPGRSVFNLSYDKKFIADMGYLYPVMCDEVVPGDVFSIGAECVLRAMPMNAPILHQVDITMHYFFCPYRLLFDDWEIFITGDRLGTDTTTLPVWTPTGSTKRDKGTLWDFLYGAVGVTPDADSMPLDFPRRAYYTIWNEYYRDQNSIAETDPATIAGAEDLLLRAWEKDYFTASLPWQQRGTAPALPLSGTGDLRWPSGTFNLGAGTHNVGVSGTAATAQLYVNNANGIANLESALETGTVDFAGATTFDVADLRLTFQLQAWAERNARAGVRYTEFLQAHFGVSPRDDRLDRMEYIGGAKQPVIVSEVLQTSEDGTSPQGTMAGHGISVNRQKIGRYRVKEHGLIMGLLSVLPKPTYHQGINRQWFRKTRYDFYSPEFANLSEQGIEQREIYLTASKVDNETLFGYIGRYDEMRVKNSMVHGDMHDTFDYWHMCRQFSSAPTLGQTFLQCNPRKDFLKATSEPAFVINYANIIRAVRPMPAMAEPGLG